jgi:hypothetical protein
MGPPSNAPKISGPRLLHHKAITTYPLFWPLQKRDNPRGFQRLLFETKRKIMLLDIEKQNPPSAGVKDFFQLRLT